MKNENLLQLCSRPPRVVVEHPIYRLGDLPYFYIPIEEQEKSLNEIFGVYEVNNIRINYLTSHVQVTIQLCLEFDGIIYNFEGIGIEPYEGNIIPIAVSIAKSKAISDAAENLGNYFGRNLNRAATIEKTKEDEEIDKKLVALEKTLIDLPYKAAIIALEKSEFSKIPKLINLVKSKKDAKEFDKK